MNLLGDADIAPNSKREMLREELLQIHPKSPALAYALLNYIVADNSNNILPVFPENNIELLGLAYDLSERPNLDLMRGLLVVVDLAIDKHFSADEFEKYTNMLLPDNNFSKFVKSCFRTREDTLKKVAG